MQFNLRNTLALSTASLAALGLAAAAPSAFGQTLYVDQVGATGAASASSAGTAIFLDEYDTSGNLGNSFNLSTYGTNTIVDTGNAGSEGALNLAGNYLTFAGYDTPVGTASLPGAVNRGVGIVNLTTGAVDTSTSLTSATTYSGNNIRSAVTGDGANIFTAGTASSITTGGVRHTTDGGTTSSSVESSTNANTRVVEEYNGNVYYSTGSATGVGATGIYELGPATSTTAATPTAVATTANINGGLSVTSPYAFVFASPTTLYVADSSSGLLKFTNSGGGFTETESLALTNLTGLTVDPLTGTLYGVAGSFTTGTGANTVTTDSMLYSFTDSGTALSDSVLATASSAGYNFRGVQVVDAAPVALVAPAPEPSGFVAMFIGMGALGLAAARRRKGIASCQAA